MAHLCDDRHLHAQLIPLGAVLVEAFPQLVLDGDVAGLIRGELNQQQIELINGAAVVDDQLHALVTPVNPSPNQEAGFSHQMICEARVALGKDHSLATSGEILELQDRHAIALACGDLAHYPVAYMAALRTVNSGAADKVHRYNSNCNAMGIEVMPPDENASHTEFTPTGDRNLIGLSAVRNLGDGAIRQLIAARDSDGPFRSLADLCDRIPSSVLNRRGLESLVHCGAQKQQQKQSKS